jgi:hypothetical protein
MSDDDTPPPPESLRFSARSTSVSSCATALLLAAMLVVAGAAAPPAAQAQDRPAPQGVSAEVERRATRAVHGADMEGKDGPMAKIDRSLVKLYYDHRQYRKASQSAGSYRPRLALSRAMSVGNGTVAIDALARDGRAAAMMSDLKRLGLEGGARAGRLVSGRLPIDRIAEAAKIGGLHSLRPVVARTADGAAQSQGDAAMRADSVRSATGLSGAGQTVGVLSDTYNNADFDLPTTAEDDIESGDLPPADQINVLDDTAPPGIDEGRAMMQLIHDVAPGADLAFHTAFNGRADFAQGIRELADAGATVIVDDIIYYAEPMFQDGVVAQAATDVTERGVPYFSSAGNAARQSYASDYREVEDTLSVARSTARASRSGRQFAPSVGTETHLPGESVAVEYDGTLATDSTVTDSIGFASPEDGYDWYCASATAGQEITLDVERTAGDILPNLAIGTGEVADGESVTSIPLQANTSNDSLSTASLSFTPAADTTVTVMVSTWNGEDGGDYALSASGLTAASACGDVNQEPGFFHDFDPSSSVDVTQSISVPLEASGTFSVQWDDPHASAGGAGADTDLDVYILDKTGEVIQRADSRNVGGDPVELFGFLNDGSIDADGDGEPDTRFQIAIERVEGPAPGRVKYAYFGNVTVEEYATQSPTSYGHSNSANVVAVGAAFYQDTPEFGTSPPQVRSFSALGGVPILFDTDGNRLTEPEVRQTPDVTAPDGTNTTFFIPGNDPEDDGFPNFNGTSAAAPHAAALAALQLEADPGLTPAEVTDAQQASAIDMDDPATGGFDTGYDYRTGAGLVQAGEAIGDAGSPPVAQIDTSAVDETLQSGSSTTQRRTIQNTASASDARDLRFDARVAYGASSVVTLGTPSAQRVAASGNRSWAAATDRRPRPAASTNLTPIDELPVLLDDPDDDAVGGTDSTRAVEATRVLGDASSERLEFAIQHDSTVVASDYGGALYIDVDQDSASGSDGAFTNPEQQIGAEYAVDFFALEDSIVVVREIGAEEATSVPAQVDSATVQFAVPLEDLGGDDGNVDVAGVVGNAQNPTDWLPNAGNASLTAVPRWLAVEPAGGAVAPGGSQQLSLSIDGTNLSAGLYEATVVVESNDGDRSPREVPVRLTVEQANPPALAVNPDSVETTLPADSQVTETITITNDGAGDSQLRFAFSGYAAEERLAAVPQSKHNRTGKKYEGEVDLQKGEKDPRSGYPVTLGAGRGEVYRWIDSNEPGGPVYDFIDISDTGTEAGFGDDDGATVSLPFRFDFYGQAKTEVTISSNGYLTFGDEPFEYVNEEIPNTDAPNDAIYPYWDDLDPGDSGRVYFQAEDDRLIVQWENVSYFDESASNTFQVILRSDGTMKFQYQDVDTRQSATVGVENADGTAAMQTAFNTDYVENGLAVRVSRGGGLVTDVSPAADSLAQGESQAVTLTVEGGDRAPGTVREALSIATNDADRNPAEVPVTATLLEPTVEEVAREVVLADGWNLVSVPADAEAPSFERVLPACESGFDFAQGDGYRSIAPDEPLLAGEAGFFNCSPVTDTLRGERAGARTVEVEAGWNIVGAFGDSTIVANVTSEPGGIVSSGFIGYGRTQGYAEVDRLAPTAGYWVKASESGTLVYGGASPAAEPALAASARTPNASRKAQPEGLQLTVRDQSGRKASLRLVEGLNEDERRQAELPPAPPSGLFDVRFGAGTNAAELGDADGPGATARHTLKMQGTKGAVTIKRSALGGAAPAERAAASRKGGRADDGPRRVVKVVDAATGGSAFEARLTETSPSARVPARVNRLEVRVEGLPASVQLKGAAPNPARQRATIEYAVPEEQKVRIRVYDVLGRQIATLVDAKKQAGVHRADVDAGRLASGVYFYRLKAGETVKTKRFTVVK